MCVVSAGIRSRVQSLPADDVAALREFAEKRHFNATEEHAKAFWWSFVCACMSDDEMEKYLAGLNVYDGSPK